MEQLVLPTEVFNAKGEMIEVALHRPSNLVARDLDFFLAPCISLSQGPQSAKQVLILTTCQKSTVDLLNWDLDAAMEKDRMLDMFVSYAHELCAALRAKGHWADFTDPASGLLVLSPGQRIWPEIQALERLRGYKMGQAGGCHILLHPRWGSKMYPASIFTDAPEQAVQGLLFHSRFPPPPPPSPASSRLFQ